MYNRILAFSAIRALQPLVAMPGMISLGGGMPNPSTFPFAKLTAELTDGTSVELSGASLEAALQYAAERSHSREGRSESPRLPRHALKYLCVEWSAWSGVWVSEQASERASDRVRD